MSDPMLKPRPRINATLKLDGEAVADTPSMIRQYSRRFQTHAFQPASLFYSSDGLHTDRLRQARTLLEHAVGPAETVLDAGCGYGSLAPFVPATRYRGVDVFPAFITEAQRRFPTHAFALGDIMDERQPADWVALIGVLGTMPNPEEKLEKCCGLARRGLVLDVLDCRRSSGEYNHFSPGAMAEWLMDRGMARVDLCQSSPHPWTFLVARRDPLW